MLVFDNKILKVVYWWNTLQMSIIMPTPVAIRSKVYVYSLLSAWIADSYPAERMDIRFLCLLYVA
jgi:hypothetical protein